MVKVKRDNRGSNNPNWRGGPETRICKQCGKTFLVPKAWVRRNRGIFCSRSCSSKWNFAPERNPNFKRVKRTCKECSKEFTLPLSHVRKRSPNDGCFCGRECRGKWDSKHFGEKAKKMWRDPKYVEKVFKGLDRRPNKPDKRLIEISHKHFPGEFGYNGNFDLGIMIGGLIPDFVNVNGKKLLIEVFGDYWHDPNRKDIKWHQTEWGRKAVYSKYGYKTLIIWEHELKNIKIPKVIKKIRNFIRASPQHP